MCSISIRIAGLCVLLRLVSLALVLSGPSSDIFARVAGDHQVESVDDAILFFAMTVTSNDTRNCCQSLKLSGTCCQSLKQTGECK